MQKKAVSRCDRMVRFTRMKRLVAADTVLKLHNAVFRFFIVFSYLPT